MPEPTSFSVLQITDPHILATPEATLLGINTAYYFDAVLNHAFSSGQQYDLCLLTGDLAQDPCQASYAYILAKLQAFDILCPFICLPGNHDDFNIMQTVFCTARVNCRKRLVLGNWQIVTLNSEIPGSAIGHLAPEELAFLENCLIEHPGLNTLIAVHHHCIPTGSFWIDTMIIDNASDLLDLISRYPNAKIVITGHIHQAMDVQVDTVRVLTTPSTCFQFKPNSERFTLDNLSPGYRWLKLYDDGNIDTDVVRIPEQLTGLQNNSTGY